MNAFNVVVNFYDQLKVDYEEKGYHDSSEGYIKNYKKAFNIFESEFEI